MKFNKRKCKKNKSMHQCRLESRSAEWYLGILVDEKLNQLCAVVAKKAFWVAIGRALPTGLAATQHW